MATIYWLGKAEPVAQVTTVTVGGVLAGETYYCSHKQSSGNIITALTLRSGTVDFDGLPVNRAIGTYSYYGGTYTDSAKSITVATSYDYT